MKRLALLLSGLACACAAAAGAAGPVVTITAYPLVTTSSQPVVLSGRIADPKAGELVTVEGKECGVPGGVFRALAAAQTADGGTWTTDYRPRSKTTLRATWRDGVSSAVTVQVRAFLTLVPRPGNRLNVVLYGIGAVTGKRVVLERFDPGSRAWRTVRTVALHSEYGEAGTADVKVALPRGTTVRARLPLSQAKPCYLAGYSKLART